MPSILASALLAAALTAAPTQAPTAAAPGYHMVVLGTLGGDHSSASAMNDLGDVVGRSQAADGTYRGFFWHQGHMVDLGAFTPTDVNNRGQVIGTLDYGLGGRVWHQGVMRPLDGLPVSPVAINDRGQIVGGDYTGTFLWTNGHARPLPLAAVSDVNENGQVAGGILLPDGFHAALWHLGRVTDLGAGPFNRSNTYALNDSGWAIGWQFSARQDPRGFLWRNGRALDIGTLGGDTTQPLAINNRGEILAVSTAADNFSRPALWRGGVLHDLSLAGVNRQGEVVDLDDQGRIAGSIRLDSGDVRAVVYEPQ
ncbi:hypothetical protein [Micromonospora profundi]|uniref:hypothetical protein n=1 Tax=Micromonospora profundi TaxID=1420889 RepID=UPI00364B9929